jgi:hypothetical protein
MTSDPTFLPVLVPNVCQSSMLVKAFKNRVMILDRRQDERSSKHRTHASY